MATIRKQEVRTFILNLLCDECGGQMVFKGDGLLTYPPKFPHICMECGKEVITDKIYPATEYEYLTVGNEPLIEDSHLE
jgi:DNA-directed RNA polymerase subunit RPC12/RpoP